MEKEPTKKKGRGLRALLIIVGVLLVIGIIGALFDGPGEHPAEADGQTAAAQEAVSNWKYSSRTDPMTDGETRFAATYSTNRLEFEFPYDGGSTGHIIIRNGGAGNEVLFGVDKGQLLTSLMSSEKVRVRFDDGPAETYAYNSAKDGTMTTVFLTRPEEFVRKLRGARKAMVEAPFFNAGNRILYFDVEGLEWN